MAMNAPPDRLWSILSAAEVDGTAAQDEQCCSEREGFQLITRQLDEWSNETDALLRTGGGEKDEEANNNDRLVATSHALHQRLVGYLLLPKAENPSMEDETAGQPEAATNYLVKQALARWKKKAASADHDSDDDQSPLSLLQHAYLRASKIFLRWYLLILAPRPQPPKLSALFWKPWKHSDMLALYLVLLETMLDESSAQCVTQILFYATSRYGGSSLLENEDCWKHLIDPLDVARRWLRLLVQQPQRRPLVTHGATATTSLTLSLLRNVHNLIVSYPPAKKHFLETRVVSANNDSGQETQSYATLLTQKLEESVKDPRFAGGDRGPILMELVLEILRTLFALEVGRDFTTPHDPLCEPLFFLIQLDARQQQTQPANHPYSLYDCKLVAVQILMDANAFLIGDCVLQYQALGALLKMLERQVTNLPTADQDINAHAATLLPILVLFHKMTQSNQSLCQQVKAAVFPQKLPSDLPLDPNNMSPLRLVGAETNALQDGLIHLLTWPVGQIKRLAGELLWTLCQGSSREFKARVGVGNALPMLRIKGVIQLPSQLQT